MADPAPPPPPAASIRPLLERPPSGRSERTRSLNEIDPDPTTETDPNKPYPYNEPESVATDDTDIKKYKSATFLNPGDEILELINNSISKLVADIKKTYLGNTNDEVNIKTTEIINGLTAITQSINNELPDDATLGPSGKITTQTEFFKMRKDNTKAGNKYKYLEDVDNDTGNNINNQDKFNIDTTNVTNPLTFGLKKTYRDLAATVSAAPTDFTTLDSANIIAIGDIEYMKAADGTDIEADAGTIQKRLNNCYTLELLYMKKHEELLKLFAFLLNLFDKYKYAIKLVLYLLKSLVYREKTTIPITGVKLPRPLITKIGDMVADQTKIQGIVDSMQAQLEGPLGGIGSAAAVPPVDPEPFEEESAQPPEIPVPTTGITWSSLKNDPLKININKALWNYLIQTPINKNTSFTNKNLLNTKTDRTPVETLKANIYKFFNNDVKDEKFYNAVRNYLGIAIIDIYNYLINKPPNYNQKYNPYFNTNLNKLSDASKYNVKSIKLSQLAKNLDYEALSDRVKFINYSNTAQKIKEGDIITLLDSTTA